MHGAHITVANLTMAYRDFVIQKNMNFTVNRGDIFIVMGGSGCGKSTLLRHLIGLKQPLEGSIQYQGTSFWDVGPEERRRLMMKMGVSYQSGALFSSMTLAENIALPLASFTRLTRAEIREVVALKLALVGLAGFEEYFPAELSGGMQKRAAIARAMALDPKILFLDEPSAGLDPITSADLDSTILDLSKNLGFTFVIVSHELASIYSIADTVIMLDKDAKGIIAEGDPKALRETSKEPRVHQFFNRIMSKDAA